MDKMLLLDKWLEEGKEVKKEREERMWEERRKVGS